MRQFFVSRQINWRRVFRVVMIAYVVTFLTMGFWAPYLHELFTGVKV